MMTAVSIVPVESDTAGSSNAMPTIPRIVPTMGHGTRILESYRHETESGQHVTKSFC